MGEAEKNPSHPSPPSLPLPPYPNVYKNDSCSKETAILLMTVFIWFSKPTPICLSIDATPHQGLVLVTTIK